MSIQFFLGAYWRARRESIEQCTDRLYRMFSGLCSCDETLATWYAKGRSRTQALQNRVHVGNRDDLLRLLDRGRNRRDTDKSVIEELGFDIALWNGAAAGREADVSLCCGLYTPNPNLGNCVALSLPEDLGKLRRSERTADVLAAVVAAWEPDWAGVMSNEAMNARQFDARVPFVDWMLYLSNRLAPQIQHLPQLAVARNVDGLGSIIVVQSEPPNPANPEDVRNIERVEAALRSSGQYGSFDSLPSPSEP